MPGIEAPPDPAYFDDSRKALVFALNATRPEMPRPVMNKAMAEAVQKAWRTARKGSKRYTNVKSEALQLLEAEQAPPPRKSRHGPAPLRGLDRAHQAGFILSVLARLDPPHQLILKGLLIQAYEPCECRSPCCSGRRKGLRWAEAVKGLCTHIAEAGDIVRQPGKRGLSTQPAMRLAFVEQYCTKNSMTLMDAAAIGKVTTVTAARHRAWIVEYLAQVEQEAWLSIDALFDQTGITGTRT